MKCEKCGAEVSWREEFCPECGRSLSSSSYKPLQEKYFQGADFDDFNEEYHGHHPQYIAEEEKSGSGTRMILILILMIIGLILGVLVGIIIFSNGKIPELLRF